MYKLIITLYNILPKKLVEKIGKSRLLIPIRNLFLRRRNGEMRLANKWIEYKLSEEVKIDYLLRAPFKTVAKAQSIGIENGITRRVFQYCSKFQQQGIIIDVGANFGTLSLIWAKSLPNHIVHAFEVHPDIYRALLKSKELSEASNLFVNNIAISDCNQVLSFEREGKTASIINDSRCGDNSFQVNAIPLDELYRDTSIPILAIKIDTDGSDYNCLVGAKRIIISNKPMIVIETNCDKRIIDFLRELDYTIYGMNGKEIGMEDKMDLNDSNLSNIFAYPRPR